MVIMALDHTRDFIHAGAMSFSPEDLTRTTPIIFLTRWVTHICAPVFMCSAGAGAFLRLQRPATTRGELSWFLCTRGLALIVIELVVMRRGDELLAADARIRVLLLVLWALGLSMIVLAALIHLPRRVLVAGSIAVILLHNALDGVPAAKLRRAVRRLEHPASARRVLPRRHSGVRGLPAVPWFAVMALGFAFGPVFLLPPEVRRREFLRWGALLIAGFLVLRALNIYGDPSPWSWQPSGDLHRAVVPRATKYPPSLEFLLMTLGRRCSSSLISIAGPAGDDHPLVIFGRVPLFFYVTHFWLLHVVASVLALIRYGVSSFAFFNSPLPSMGGPADDVPRGLRLPVVGHVRGWIASSSRSIRRADGLRR